MRYIYTDILAVRDFYTPAQSNRLAGSHFALPNYTCARNPLRKFRYIYIRLTRERSPAFYSEINELPARFYSFSPSSLSEFSNDARANASLDVSLALLSMISGSQLE